MKIFAKTVDEKTLEQLSIIEKQEPFKNEKIRIMPDCHSGKGCVIGFTSTIGNKVIPNVVGVDIGCGVAWQKLGKDNFDMAALDRFIKVHIPAGRNVHLTKVDGEDADWVISRLRCKDSLRNVDWISCSLGTLGGGNHFIEVDEGEDGEKYLVVHTGSRNLGKQVAEIYQEKAINNLHIKPNCDALHEGIERLKTEGRQKEIQDFITNFKQTHAEDSGIPDELCYLEGYDMEDYLHDMLLCQGFAEFNRRRIMTDILAGFFGYNTYSYYESVHNYIDFEDHIIRKGAIKANDGQKVIIPLNMRDGCILGTGKGNADWNCSAPHGAGRLMSRGEARRDLKLEDFHRAMNGIFTTTATQDTIDESPMTYKNAKEIIDLVGETITIDSLIKPIYNFKAEG